MSKMRLVALAGAIVCALLAGLMARNLASRRPVQADAQVVTKVETSDVLVATKDLPIGARLADGVSWRPWPKDNLLEKMIVRDRRPDALTELAQARVKSAVYKDEPLLDQKIVLPGAGGYLSAILPKGMRAKSVAITSRSSAGGFILPNDRVDVILTRKITDARNPMPVVTSETVISNVRVLAVNQLYKPADGDQVAVEKGETATLEVTPQQSEILATVESAGDLSLALRSIAENEGLTADQVQPALEGRFAGKIEKKAAAADPLFIRNGVESYASSQ